MRLGLISAFLTFTTMALAAPKPLPATQHEPALTFNLATTWIQIVSQDVQGYKVHTEFLIGGAASKGDRLRFSLRSGGKVLGTGACESNYFDEVHTLRATCALDRDGTEESTPVFRVCRYPAPQFLNELATLCSRADECYSS